MKILKSKTNRLTPFLMIILIILVWILVFIILNKFVKPIGKKIVKLKLDDELVMELYSSISDEDIKNYSIHKYELSSLPSDYIVNKATQFMTIEDVSIKGNQIVISYESLDSAIKTAFGPDYEYKLSKDYIKTLTNLEYNEHPLLINVKYDSTTNSYIGTYEEVVKENNVFVEHKLLNATKDKYVNLEIGYIFYLKNDKYQICKDYTCTEFVNTLDNLDDIKYDNSIVVSLKKQSDDLYYYEKNS